jgi:hypothetical protein
VGAWLWPKADLPRCLLFWPLSGAKLTSAIAERSRFMSTWCDPAVELDIGLDQGRKLPNRALASWLKCPKCDFEVRVYFDIPNELNSRSIAAE